MRKQLSADGRVLTLRIEPRTMDLVDGLMMPRTNYPVFATKDADELAAAVGRAGTVDLEATGPVMIAAAPGRRPRAVMLRGVRVPPPIVRDYPPVAGRFFTAAEGMGGAFYVAFLLRAGVPVPIALLTQAGILAGRFVLRAPGSVRGQGRPGPGDERRSQGHHEPRRTAQHSR